MKKVAIIGTVGLPAKYGGFETLVENLVSNYSQNVEYTVFCSSKSYLDKPKTYKNARLRYLNIRANGIQSIYYDIVSIILSLRHYDCLLILGVSGCIILPMIKWLYRGKLIINIDGLEHRRAKWGRLARKFLKFSEKIAVRYADIVIADNEAIQQYVEQEYGCQSMLIAYGGDHVITEDFDPNDILSQYDIASQNYSFGLCRIEPENNVHMILDAFAEHGSSNLVFVGNWQNSAYGMELKEKYGSFNNIKLLSPIYDIRTLNALRSNCIYYLHGHSAGGTNPSLVEAMFFTKPIFAFDCLYNRYSTDQQADYFANSSQLKYLLEQPTEQYINNAIQMKAIAEKKYKWAAITEKYNTLFDCDF